MDQCSSAVLEEHLDTTTDQIPEITLFREKIKLALAELIILNPIGVESFSKCVEKCMPIAWHGHPFAHFLHNLKNSHLVLLKPQYQGKQQHLEHAQQCIQRIIITLNDIFKIPGKECELFESFEDELQRELTTLNLLKCRLTYTNGDLEFNQLLDQIETITEAYEKSLATTKSTHNTPLELTHLKSLIASHHHSLFSDWNDLRTKLSHANGREWLHIKRESECSKRFGLILERLIENLVNFKLDAQKDLAPEVRSLIDDGILSQQLLSLCGRSDESEFPSHLESICHNSSKSTQGHVIFTKLSGWLNTELQNALEIPYRKAIFQTLLFYRELIHHHFTDMEDSEIEIKASISHLAQNTELRLELESLRKVTFFIVAYEQNLGKGRSATSTQHIREYSKLCDIQKRVNEDLTLRFVKLNRVDLYRTYVDKMQENLKQLMLTKYHAKLLLLKATKYLDQKLSHLTHKATLNYNQQSITYRLQQLLIETTHSIEDKNSNTAFIPILNLDRANLNIPMIENAVANLEKYFPIFKRPLGCIKEIQPKPIALTSWLHTLPDVSFEKRLIDLNDQLRNYQLKSRETRILLMPSEGNGSYDPYTNTLIVSQIISGDHELEGLYRAIATYLFKTRIQNDATAYKELTDVLSLRHKNIKKRQHYERIIIQAFCKHLMEVTGIIHTSGHTQKERKVISSHLDHPNHLIQCREIINIPIHAREACLESIMSQLNLTKLENLSSQIIKTFENPTLQELNSELTTELRLITIFENLDSETRIKIIENLFDLGVIEFHKHHLGCALECFLILRYLSPESQEVWWNVATILNFHAFDGYSNLVKDRKKTALEAYKKFEKTEGVSEYWIKKSRDLRQTLELKHF